MRATKRMSDGTSLIFSRSADWNWIPCCSAGFRSAVVRMLGAVFGFALTAGAAEPHFVTVEPPEWELVLAENPTRENAVELSLGRIPDSWNSKKITFDSTHRLNLTQATGFPLQARQSAILTARIVAPEDGVVLASAGADYYFEFFREGKSYASTLQHGNGGTPISADDRLFSFPVKKGVNRVALLVQAGSGGWECAIRFPEPNAAALRRFSRTAEVLQAFPPAPQLRYGPWITHPQTGGVSIHFTSEGPMAAAVDFRKNGEESWTRRYELWNGYLRRDTDRHSISLQGLESATDYQFRIVFFPKDESLSGLLPQHPKFEVAAPLVYSFRTMPALQDPVTFFVMSDTHMPGLSRLEMLRGYDRAWRFETADFFVHLGDISNTLDNFDDEVLGGLAEYFCRRNRVTPLCVVHGNHEYVGGEAGLWNPSFSAPDGKSYYAFRCGPAFFLVLAYWGIESDATNLHELDREQERWAEAMLKSEAARTASFRIILNHCPPGGDRADDITDPTARLLARLNQVAPIDLFLAGHVHEYRRTVLCGTTVVVLDGGRSPEELNLTAVRVTPEQLTVQSGKNDGKLFDSFTLKTRTEP